jgi:PAS domain S-box-containing protein
MSAAEAPPPVDPTRQALLDSEAEFSAMFEVASVGMAQADGQSGRLLRVNRGLAGMLGRTPEELIGVPFVDLTHPDDRAENWDAFERLVRGEIPSFDLEKRLLHRDGRAVWVLMSVNLVGGGSSGAPARTAAVIMDIGRRKLAEEACAASEQRLRRALRATRLGLWEWDLATDELHYSAEFAAIAGQGAREGSEPVANVRRRIHPEDAEAIWALDQAARRGEPYEAEYRVRRPDGSVRWVADHAQPVFDAEGRPQRMVGTLSDITERKQADHALRSAVDDLDIRVRERTTELAKANASLLDEVTERRATESQVRELVGQLFRAEEEERRRMSRDLHDSVGQHVAALSLHLKVIEESQGKPELAKQVEHARDAVRRLEDDVDRLSHELRPPLLDDLGLEEALRQHALSWSQDSGVAVDLHLSGLPPQRLPLAVETTVYRVVQEAMTNVRRHASATRVGLIVECRGGSLRAIVEDNGCGFTAERPPGRTDRRRRLGLKGMAERAALVGGRLEMETSPGQGTTVFLSVPLENAEGVIEDSWFTPSRW